MVYLVRTNKGKAHIWDGVNLNNRFRAAMARAKD